MFRILKTLLAFFTISLSLQTAAQSTTEACILDYAAICDGNELFENHYRINNRIVSKNFRDGILSLSVDLYGNCSISDTSWISLSNDSLKIWTGPRDTIVGQNHIIISASECNCYYHLSYEIGKLACEPNTVLINGKEIKQSKDKFLAEQFMSINGKEYLQYDTNGLAYKYEFYESGKLKRIRTESGLLAKVWYFSEAGQLTEILIDNRALPGGKLERKYFN
jgi:hypothetical protein